MGTNIRIKPVDFEEFDFDEEVDDHDFFSDDLRNYTDTMSDFKDK